MNKQIEDSARLSEKHCRIDNQCGSCSWETCNECFAEYLYNAGYRKASELIAEIDNAIHNMAMQYANVGHPEYFPVCAMVRHEVIRPIKKKYTEDEK